MVSSLPLSTPSVLYLHLRLSKDRQRALFPKTEAKYREGVELGVNGSEWKRRMRRKQGEASGGREGLKKGEREAKDKL